MRERLGRGKIAYASEDAARDQALLMDLKHGMAFSAYPCRWGNHYRDGEVFAVHWHVGRNFKRGERGANQ